MELDIPALKPGRYLSIGLPNRHGAPAVTAVTAACDGGKLVARYLENGLELP